MNKRWIKKLRKKKKERQLHQANEKEQKTCLRNKKTEKKKVHILKEPVVKNELQNEIRTSGEN